MFQLFFPGFMLQIDFYFLVLKSSVDLPRLWWIYVLLLHTPFVFRTKKNVQLLAYLNYLSPHSGIRIIKLHSCEVVENGALEISYGFMRVYHNINIIFQTIGGDASSLNWKIKITNKTLYNITRSLLLSSSCKR